MEELRPSLERAPCHPCPCQHLPLGRKHSPNARASPSPPLANLAIAGMPRPSVCPSCFPRALLFTLSRAYHKQAGKDRVLGKLVPRNSYQRKVLATGNFSFHGHLLETNHTQGLSFPTSNIPDAQLTDGTSLSHDMARSQASQADHVSLTPSSACHCGTPSR